MSGTIILYALEFRHKLCSSVARVEEWWRTVNDRPKATQKAAWVIAYDRHKDLLLDKEKGMRK